MTDSEPRHCAKPPLGEEIMAIINSLFDDSGVQGLIAFAAAFFVGVAVAVWAVAVTHLAFGNFTVAATVFAAAAAKATITIGSISPDPSHEFILQLWGFHGGDIDQTYVRLSACVEDQINSVIEALQEHFPEKFEGANLDNIKQFLALNVQKSLE